MMSIPQGGFWNWNLQTMNFTAASTSELLNFMAVGIGAPPVALLAEVSLSAVPEPETWAMMLAGFAGLGLVGYRRGRKVRAAASA
jgi:hypothetical protein